MTPEIERTLLNRSEADIVNRHKQFRARIAQKAAELIMACSDAPLSNPTAAEPRLPTYQDRIDEWVDSHRDKFWFHIVDEDGEKRPPVALIQRVCAAHYKVTVRDILSERRTANVVKPRQVAMYLARHMTLRTFPEIGRRFGNRDHTTALSAVRKITRLTKLNKEFDAEVSALEEDIRRQM